MESPLVGRLADLSSTLNPAERENLKLLLSMAAGGLLVGHAPAGTEELRRVALATAQQSLPRLHSSSGRPMFDAGIVFQGQSPFFTARDLAVMNQESLAHRHKAQRFHDHYVTSGAPVARELALSQSITEFLTERVGPVLPTYKANYLYYDEPGLGIDPHVDKNDFSLNVLTMLEHLPHERTSELILHPPEAPAVHIQLQPGECLIFFADSVTHQRTRTVAGESIRLVSFGYHTI